MTYCKIIVKFKSCNVFHAFCDIMLLGSNVKKRKNELENEMKFNYIQNLKYDLVDKYRGSLRNMVYLIQIEQTTPTHSVTHVFKDSNGESIHIHEMDIVSSKLSLG